MHSIVQFFIFFFIQILELKFKQETELDIFVHSFCLHFIHLWLTKIYIKMLISILKNILTRYKSAVQVLIVSIVSKPSKVSKI